MEKNFRKIAVLTSGGDAPGMNAAVRAVVNCAQSRGVEVYGLMRGYSGLLEDDMKILSARDVANIAGLGGTVLYSDRCLRFKTPEGMADALKNCEKNQIDGIVAIGGDGTFRGATGSFQSRNPHDRNPRHDRQRHNLHRLLDRLRHRNEHGSRDG